MIWIQFEYNALKKTPLLRALPLLDESEQGLVRLDALLDGLQLGVSGHLPFVEELLFVDELDGLLCSVENLLDRSHVWQVLLKKNTKKRRWRRRARGVGLGGITV